MIVTPEKIVSDDEVERVHANANFGGMGKRTVLAVGVWHAACGYHMGSTMETIIVQHGLARRRADRRKPVYLTPKGKRYLMAVLPAAEINWRSN